MGLRSAARRFRRNEDGAVAIEFALVVPLLLAFLLGIICFGYYFAVSSSVQQLAADTARQTVSGITTAERESIATDYLAAAGTNYPLLDASKLTHTMTVADASGSTDGSIDVSVTYDLQGSVIQVVDAFLGFDIPSISRSAYLAY